MEDNGTIHSSDKTQNVSDEFVENPKTLLIFIDEINRFPPSTYQTSKRSSEAEQIIKTIVTGKSRNTILFSAQQFKSAVDTILHENTGINTFAKLGSSDLTNSAYAMLDENTKRNIVYLDKWELVMIQPAFRHPIKVIISKPPSKRRGR